MKKIRFERNKIILAIIDILIIALACIFSKFLLSNTFYFKAEEWKQIGITIALSIVIYQIFFRIFNLYRSITRYENGRDYLIYIFVCAISCITTYIIKNIFKIDTFTTKECILSCVLIAVGTVSCRVVIRMLLNETLPAEKKNDEPIIAKRLLIIGAGRSSRDIIKAIREGLKNTYYIVGLIDDNPAKWNCSISGVKILGNRDKIQEVCKKYNVQEIFFSITNISPENKKELLHICQETNAKIRILPSTEDIIKNKNVLDSLKEVEIEDLLGRDPIKLDNNNIESLIKGHAILVTGGGGSIGSELCRQIATFNPELLIIFDIYENNLYNIELELRAKYPNLNIKGIIGSVRDKKKLEDVFSKYRPYLVFHAAAHKHVPLMEVSPLEAIKNNVLGTQNVADCADKFGTKRFILISTDKAVNPTNIMGASKRMCEMVIQAKNKTSKTEYAAVRFGNVLGSNGSVVPLFKKQIKEGGPVTVTHKDITRFFMTIPEAVGLVLQAMTYAKGGEVFVLDMGEPVKIYDLAVSLIKLSGLQPDIDIPIEITGLRPGEKLYEELLMSEEGLEHTKHNKIFVAEPLDIPAEEVNKRVEMLREFVQTENHTMEEIKKVVKKAVPTFVEAEEKNKKIINYKQELEEIEARQMQENDVMPKEA